VRRDEEAGGGGMPPVPPPEPPVYIETVEPPEAPPTAPSEKEKTRKWLSLLITFLVIGVFLCVGARYFRSNDPADRTDFVHLIEILLVIYGTILGFYFGSQD